VRGRPQQRSGHCALPLQGLSKSAGRHLESLFPGQRESFSGAIRRLTRLPLQSDVEDNTPEVADEVEVSGDAPKGQMSVLDALKGVLKLALIHDGLARGLREASKALDRRQAHMCVLNENCEEEAYKKLVIGLCSEHKIPLIKVPDGKQLGEWAGLCMSTLSSTGMERPAVSWTTFLEILPIATTNSSFSGVLDREGNARKVVNCSCVVVKDWGEESQERSILLNYFQTEQ
jgi:small subunit ribosomal protein S12e